MSTPKRRPFWRSSELAVVGRLRLLRPGGGRQGGGDRGHTATPWREGKGGAGLAAGRARPGGGEQAEGAGEVDGLGTVVGAELGVQVPDVGLDGVG